MATENIKLLGTEKGTHMFVCITNRIKTKCFCKEVIYQGFEIHKAKRSYEEPGKVKYTEWEEPEYYLDFSLIESPYTIFSVFCKYTGNLMPQGGIRHYDTDEHLEYGANIGCDDPEPNSTLSSLHASFDCLDVYFTTNREKFIKYINDDGILNNINLQLQCVKNMVSDIESFIKPDSVETKEGIAETEKYKIINTQYRGRYAAGLAENKQWVKYILMRFECGYILSDIYFNDHRYDIFDYDEYDNFKKEWPSIYDEETDTIWLKIDVSDGTVVNWPEGKTADFDTVKLVDGGTYEMYDAEDTLIAHYKGYVPEMLSINTKGWGDYLEFNIGPDRKIINWSFDSMDKYNEFMRNCGALED